MRGIHMGEVSKIRLGLGLAAWYVEAGTETLAYLAVTIFTVNEA
jgi:hypothetical protein